MKKLKKKGNPINVRLRISKKGNIHKKYAILGQTS